MSGAAAEGRLPACARSSSGHVCRHTSATTAEAMMAETESCANCCPRVDSLQAFLMHLCICFSSPQIGSVHPVTSPGKKKSCELYLFHSSPTAEIQLFTQSVSEMVAEICSNITKFLARLQRICRDSRPLYFFAVRGQGPRLTRTYR